VRSRSNLLVILGIAFFVVGGLIVYLITSDDGDDGGGSGGGKVTAVVATTDISAGDTADELIEANKLKEQKIEPEQLVTGAIGSLTQLQGATFTQNFGANQQITQLGVQLANNRTFDIPEGFDAVAVQLDFVPGVAAYVSPGDRINLYGTASAEDGTERAELVLTNVEVLDVDLTIAPRRGTATDPEATGAPRASSDAVTYLLALRPEDAEKVIFLTEFQGLYAALVRDEADPAGPTPGRDDGSIFSEEPNTAFNG
jgi:Flp pilus assembly protein CpaB